MTTDARRTELEAEARAWCLSRCAAEDRDDGNPHRIALLDPNDVLEPGELPCDCVPTLASLLAEAESRGIAKGRAEAGQVREVSADFCEHHTDQRCLAVVIGQRDEAIRIATGILDTLLLGPVVDGTDVRAALERLRGGRD